MLPMLTIEFVICTWIRFLLVVLGVYKQICNQSVPVMSDIDEDNFDRAFGLLRPGTLHPDYGLSVIDVVSHPVIQGTADIGKTLTEDELQVRSL